MPHPFKPDPREKQEQFCCDFFESEVGPIACRLRREHKVHDLDQPTCNGILVHDDVLCPVHEKAGHEKKVCTGRIEHDGEICPIHERKS